CLIVVSHDRYFMDKVVDHLFVFQGGGEVLDFPGNYSDFRTYEDSKVSEKRNKDTPKTEKKNWKATETKTKLSYQQQKEYNRLEKDIAKLERERDGLQQKFATEDWDNEEINKQSITLQNIIDSLGEKEMRWFELSEKIEE
ncbi:MAG: ATP-binding cassette subfamily F protein uup, partial [Candidatus Paceibacteria bacterium]